MNHADASAAHPRGPAAPRGLRAWLLLGVLGGAASCSQQSAPPPPRASSAPKEAPADSEPISLEINGFNYTDLYIDSFEVNGQSGGNLFVSSTTSGGGGSVCCTRWIPGSQLPLRVSWSRDGKRWCEQEVSLPPSPPAAPRHLGVHFFPDGHIEAELTEDYPDLKLALERDNPEERRATGNTINDERMSRCKDAKQPEQAR
ncbi:DUF3304 domain-containing protein [Hyalangium versicolor]|uniref:DUF3304 domain-containing protein n=1 Tax=Hyalangium versicolor TaxID=2861190 RepID=UPI001CCFC20B|nr:DUF3304 domain-containing protein [Hyalangium versicolor]